MDPSKFIFDVTKRDLGQQIGTAMSVNVIERVLLRALQALHMIADTVTDRWKSGEALQEIKLTKGKFQRKIVRQESETTMCEPCNGQHVPRQESLRALPLLQKRQIIDP